MTWDGAARWGRAPGLLETRVADRVTILAPGEELPVVLDGSARIVIDLIPGRTLQQVVTAITQAYDVDVNQVRADVDRVVSLLAGRGILIAEQKGAHHDLG